MKSLKPFVFVLAGILIAIALFSFKNEAPKKEYLLAYNKYGWTIVKPDLTVVKHKDGLETEVKMINDLANEGWELKGATTETVNRYLYFERVKQ